MTQRPSARITRQSGTSFYYAFRVLPKDKREAIYALYSFCRVVDDCVDEESGEGEPGLRRWLEEAHRCYAGKPQTELGQDLALALLQFPIPRSCFEDIVAGCRMDLTVRRYPVYADLRLYCERVAAAVGLASIEIFGYEDPRTRDYAVELGVALQLTNIVRDVAADAVRERDHGRERCRDRPGGPAHRVCGHVRLPAAAVAFPERRAGQRLLPVCGRRRDLDEAHGSGTLERPAG